MAANISRTAVFSEIIQRTGSPILSGSTRNFSPLRVPRRNCQSEEIYAGDTEFGLFFDIDGVITRGRTLLPHSKSAFKLLTDNDGKFTIPAIFVTNAGNSMRPTKAKQLSDWLEIQIDPDQVVMSHSPLKMFKQSHKKHMLISGQGPIIEIAKHLGFSNVITLDVFRQCFPALDTVDHKRRKAAPCAFEKYFPKIEGIVLFGEPVRWESSLQLIIDILMSDGRPSEAVTKIPYPHLPILACNMDVVWMSEAPMPRFGHGCFMNCLESLYKKITGFELKYAAQVGKPSEITYHYAEHLLQSEARRMNLPKIRRMYCIGDNPAVDIYGANLFNRRVHRKIEKQNESVERLRASSTGQPGTGGGATTGGETLITPSELPPVPTSPVYELSGMDEDLVVTIESCESILVCTGVFQGKPLVDRDRPTGPRSPSDAPLENPPAADVSGIPPEAITADGIAVTDDHVMDVSLCVPSITTVHNVHEAVIAILEKEGIHAHPMS